MSVAEIKRIAELKKVGKEIADQIGGPHMCDANAGIYRVLDLINSFEAGQEKPIVRGKQALEFLKWLAREIKVEYPETEYLLSKFNISKNLENVRLIVSSLVNLEDDKKILGEGEGGEKG